MISMMLATMNDTSDNMWFKRLQMMLVIMSDSCDYSQQHWMTISAGDDSNNSRFHIIPAIQSMNSIIHWVNNRTIWYEEYKSNIQFRYVSWTFSLK